MSTPVVTRFAPSPTGLLHIGGVRTALFSWLYARRMKGQFILRVEDTDIERSTPEAVKVILEGMAWLGLAHDQGPFYQTQRFDRYKEVIAEMVKAGTAYHCYCSKEELDVVHGAVTFQNKELDDLIIARSDGTPTYNFCVVVDDADMGVTHVIRGDDHLNNTPRQMNMLLALGKTPPVYAHVPMILGPDGAKLSKRHGAVSVLEYQDQGYLPEALLNYLVRLGWSHGDQEYFTRDEMIAAFDVRDINKAASALNPEKMLWLNQQHMVKAQPKDVVPHLRWHLARLGIYTQDDQLLEGIVLAQRERAKTLKEMAENSRFFFGEEITLDAKAAEKHLTTDSKALLRELTERFKALPEWTAPALHGVLETLATEKSLGLGKIAQPLRVAVTGGTISPPIDATLALLGQPRTMARLARAVDR
jgi:glutamyl-tRNA synthetase